MRSLALSIFVALFSFAIVPAQANIFGSNDDVVTSAVRNDMDLVVSSISNKDIAWQKEHDDPGFANHHTDITALKASGALASVNIRIERDEHGQRTIWTTVNHKSLAGRVYILKEGACERIYSLFTVSCDVMTPAEWKTVFDKTVAFAHGHGAPV